MDPSAHETIPVADAASARLAEAARLLDRAVQAGCQDPHALYLLGLAHKAQGKTAEARAAFRRHPPDANVWLQLGLLSLAEGQLAQAEQEFAHSLEHQASYAACHNLLLTRLSLGQIASALALLPRARELAPDEKTRRPLELLEGLLHGVRTARGENGQSGSLLLPDLSADDEQQLLNVLRSLGDLDVLLPLLKALRAGRPQSSAVAEMYFEVLLVKAKALADRCLWLEAEKLLTPLLRDKELLQAAARPMQAAYFNLLGCLACLNQDSDAGLRHFTTALRVAGNDPSVHQNLALAHEWQGNVHKAEPHWNRFLDLLDHRLPGPPGQPDYADRVAGEALLRLGGHYTDRERWADAVPYLERATRYRPADADLLERLFRLYHLLRRNKDARRILTQLRQQKPDDPQFELYELDLVEVKTLDDIDRLLSDIDVIRQRHAADARIDDKAIALVNSVLPLMNSLGDQMSEQLGRMVQQTRSLPSYQVNWKAVRESVSKLLREFQRLRKITTKCLPILKHEEHRAVVRDLADHLERKIKRCRELEDEM